MFVVYKKKEENEDFDVITTNRSLVFCRDDACHAFSTFQKRFETKYLKATDCLLGER